MTTDAITLQSELQQFTGTEQYYYSPFYRWMKYTDGVKFFAENAGGGAYWLLDIIGTEFRRLFDEHGFLVIELRVHDNESCDLVVEDGNYNELFARKISFTDCPQGVWRFFLQGNVLMLTSEY